LESMAESENTKLNYLLTGANGLVGSYIARKILTEGGKIRALHRASTDFSFIQDFAYRIEWVEGDILDIGFLQTIFEGIDGVIHAAAIVSYDAADKDKILKTNIEGTANLVNTALIHKTKTFCHISSIAAIGEGDSLLNEKTEWDSNRKVSTYALSKYAAEMEVWRGIAEGLPAFIVNPSVVLGIGDWHRSSGELFTHASTHSAFYTKGSLNIVDARDVADIVWQLLNSDCRGERYILNAASMSYQDFLSHLDRAWGRKKDRKELSSWALWFAYYLGKIIPNSLVPSKELIRSLLESHTYSNEKIRKQLNFSFRKPEETLDWVCKGFLESH
jgi:dihydroflavonol-4-reductase